jgi:hypothetical protein
MKIAGLNLDIIWKNKTENFNIIEKEFHKVEADLFFFLKCFQQVLYGCSEVSDRNEESLEFLKKFQKKKCSILRKCSCRRKWEILQQNVFCTTGWKLLFMIKDICFLFQVKIKYILREKKNNC